MKLKANCIKWILIWIIVILIMSVFISLFIFFQDNIQQWFIYNETGLDLINLDKYISSIRNNQILIEDYYSKINYYLEFQKLFELNQFQINTLNSLLNINVYINPLIEFPILLSFFIIFVVISTIIFGFFIVFIIKYYLYKNSYLFKLNYDSNNIYCVK